MMYSQQTLLDLQREQVAAIGALLAIATTTSKENRHG